METAAFRHDFFLILPEVELVLFGLAILLFDFMLGVKDKAGNAVFAMLGVIFSGISLYRLRALGPDPIGGFSGSLIVDPFFVFFGMLFLLATALVILLSVRYLQVENEQPGCLHANMDVYHWAYKLSPLVPSEVIADCFAFAREVRTLDMRASPYDLTSLDLEPLQIETPEGRAEYIRHQRDLRELLVSGVGK